MGQITRFPIYINLILAFGAAFSAISYSLAFGLKQHDFTVVLLFFGTIAIYNLHRLVKYKRGDYDADLALKLFCSKHYFLIALTVIFSGFSMLMVFAKENMDSGILKLLMLCGVLALIYPLRIIPWRGGRIALREMPYIKPYMVGLVWAMVIVLVRPNVDDTASIIKPSLAVIAAFLQFFLITSISDIKDVHIDLPETKTLPQILGKRKFQVAVVSVVLCLFIALGLSAWDQGAWSAIHTAFAVSWLYLMTVGLLANKNRGVHFFGYLVDGTPVVQFLLVALLVS